MEPNTENYLFTWNMGMQRSQRVKVLTIQQCWPEVRSQNQYNMLDVFQTRCSYVASICVWISLPIHVLLDSFSFSLSVFFIHTYVGPTPMKIRATKSQSIYICKAKPIT